ncbi:NmrA family NAD(P)-binding protein [Actinomycetospora sp. C-140]
MIVVTGATGHVGRELVDRLAADGHPVRAVTRRPDAYDAPHGVEVVGGDAEDPASLDAVFAGADRAFLMSAQPVGSAPRPTHVPALVDAAVRAGVGHLVLLSVYRGGEGEDVIAAWSGAVEDAVTASGVPSTLLRPGRFMANALQWIPQMRRGDEVAIPFARRPAASTDPADIAAVAAVALTTSGHAGAAYQLSGPEVLTPVDELAVLAELLGRPLRAVEPPLDGVRAGMVRAGFPAHVVDAILARSEDTEDGTAVLDTVERVTGRPPATFVAWAARHLARFRDER